MSTALSARERALLDVLVEHRGRVLPRPELAHRAGLDALSPRRVDALIVGLRRHLGDDAIVTVRGRGWMLRSDIDVSTPWRPAPIIVSPERTP